MLTFISFDDLNIKAMLIINTMNYIYGKLFCMSLMLKKKYCH